jgi:hypothetical protein
LTLVLRLNQETHAPRLLVHGADHTQRHPTSRSSGHRVLDLCLTISSPLHQVSYSCLDPLRCLPCCTYHLYIMGQANTFLHTKHMVGQNHQNFPDSNSNQGKSITHYNQTNVLTTWFLSNEPTEIIGEVRSLKILRVTQGNGSNLS